MSHSFAISFHSGMTSASDLRACINANVPVGVVAGLLTGLQKIMALPHYMDRGGKVFVDSGAFTAFRRNEPMNWNPVFWTYGVLIEGTDHPENLTIVAPDIIGNQDLSVALWEEHRVLIRGWIESGARVVIPLQTGALTASALLEKAKDILGTDRFCAGIPSNLAAMSAEECSAITHHDFHVLGRVALNDEVKAKLDGILARNPGALVTADANWLRSRTRKLTLAGTVPPDRMNGFSTRRTQAVMRLLEQESY
ncbi:hypothetical protein [Pseudomonas aeruginosa]|uniref:hypothetical protein n=1 Tax=Pseudomonas aeruginosa TaxID=287 RepID=UPI000B5ECFFC|nr:hypothetical protein [Pseudomonas aeruginosa]ASJ88618.1 hypothetical protein PSA83_06492 [Pseudomonas aeruginosa]